MMVLVANNTLSCRSRRKGTVACWLQLSQASKQDPTWDGQTFLHWCDTSGDRDTAPHMVYG
jgi:hypothetical protein